MDRKGKLEEPGHAAGRRGISGTRAHLWLFFPLLLVLFFCNDDILLMTMSIHTYITYLKCSESCGYPVFGPGHSLILKTYLFRFSYSITQGTMPPTQGYFMGNEESNPEAHDP